jgi:hypothetical protein
MAPGLQLRFLPANEGDAIWVRWGDDLQFQMLVDAGRDGAGKRLRTRLEELPEPERHFELFVVTHVDADHIGGVLTALVDQEPLDGLTFGDFWFNGWAHLNGDIPDLEHMGGAQGVELTNWLASTSTPWNAAFDHAAVVAEHAPDPIELADGMMVTVVGPPRERFTALKPEWAKNVNDAIAKGRLPPPTPPPPGLEAMGRKRPTKPELETAAQLEALADTTFISDDKAANGSSICVMLEWGGRRVLLTGDAHPGDVVAGLASLEPSPRTFDVVKLPHHGSKNNTSDEMLDALDCATWVISTNGGIHYHPDAEAIARVVRARRTPRPELVFNEPSEFNEWWDDDTWKTRFDYHATTGTAEDGATITLDTLDGWRESYEAAHRR